MSEIIDVNTGEIAVRRGEYKLRSMAIGSCIVIAVYDSHAKVAGMVHVMLPGHMPHQSSDKTKYAVSGIEELLNQMLESGSKVNNMDVCLIGAGNVLQNSHDTICQDNIKSVTTTLAEKNIPVSASVLGGTERRSVTLDAKSGRILYRKRDNPEKLLWEPAAK